MGGRMGVDHNDDDDDDDNDNDDKEGVIDWHGRDKQIVSRRDERKQLVEERYTGNSRKAYPPLAYFKLEKRIIRYSE
uniref:Expressed conserved protein n=1 Tax=Haemonchus contortus TaxID=6289 RepID=A0A7I4YF19_HAECO